MKNNQELRQLFILRRAFWVGKVKRTELTDAFKVSNNQASLDLKMAVFGRWSTYIRREGLTGRNGVVPIYGVQAPFEASASEMLKLFERRAEYLETGVTDEEFSRLVCSSPIYRSSNDILEVLMKACIHKITIEIFYVGLRKGETGKWRQVLPNGMEFNGRQWRLIAQDLNDSQKQKTYVLPRILSARNALIKLNKMVQRKISDVGDQFQVTLNAELTKDQLTAVSNEIGLNDGKIQMTFRNSYEFKKLYCDDRSGLDQIVWPVIKEIKKVI